MRTTHLWTVEVGYDFLNQQKRTAMLRGFRLGLEGKAGREIPESSRLESLEKFLANNFALSDVVDKTSRPMNRGEVANGRLKQK